jgi:hypothetical protein
MIENSENINATKKDTRLADIGSIPPPLSKRYGYQTKPQKTVP